MLELLSPGGSMEGLKAAVNAGADAIYMGGSRFGARAYAKNPGQQELLDAIDYCHIRGRKLYLTVNTLLKQKELEEELYGYLLPAYEHGLDAVLVQDFGVFRFIQSHFPGLDIHASTQMTISSADGALLLKEMGAKRVVLSRELSLQEIENICRKSGLEIECFVHGALCYCYSGQCLMSSLIGGRSGNRGRCAQPCRLPYELYGSDGAKCASRGQYLLSLKDICTLEILPELIDAGVCSFKIEGRMKRAEYAAGVTEIYRGYIDRYLKEGREHYQVDPEDVRALMDLYNRGSFSKGYYEQYNGPSMMSMQRPNHQGTLAAKVLGAENGKVRMQAMEELLPGDALEADASPGKPGKEWILKEHVGKGKHFSVMAGSGKVNKNQLFFRVRSDVLLQKLQEKYLNTEIQEKIKGNFILKQGESAILTVSWKNVTASAMGDMPIKAMKRPLDQDTVRRQLMKTGGTPFAFEELDIAMEEDLFYPLQALNEIRRAALASLEETILSACFRKEVNTAMTMTVPDRKKGAARQDCPTWDPLQKNTGLRASVETFEQLDEVLRSHPIVDGIYLDCQMFMDKERTPSDAPWVRSFDEVMTALHQAGKKGYLMLPPIWRERTRQAFRQVFSDSLLRLADGYLLKSSDQLMYMQRFAGKTVYEERADAADDHDPGKAEEKEWIADSNIYTWNREAREAIRDFGITMDTLPLECTRRELQDRGCTGSECVIYGYLPLMTTAQCLVKNTAGCGKKPGVRYLRDRKGKRFPVRNHCSICTNMIYNSVPLELISCFDEVLTLRPSGYRISFTFENREEVRNILQMAEDAFWMIASGNAALPGKRQENVNNSVSGTRGHFRKGVE